MPETPHRPPAGQSASLARAEAALAQAEPREGVPGTPSGGGPLSTAGIVLLWSAPVLVVTALVMLSHVMPVWLAVLCVAAGLVLLGVVLALAGRVRRHRAAARRPHRSVNGRRQDPAELTKPTPNRPDTHRTTLPFS